MRSRLLMLVAHVHIVVDKLDAGKHTVYRNVSRTAFIFQMIAAVAFSRRFVFASRRAVQLDARKPFGYGFRRIGGFACL